MGAKVGIISVMAKEMMFYFASAWGIYPTK